MAENGRIPTLHITANSVPQAYYRALKKVHEEGLSIRTQYDRKDIEGNYIDPPSRDAKVMIEITDPFSQPRFPRLSYCEIGKYIAEFLGVKDHLVVPFEKLRKMVSSNKEFEATEWPYCYHQRLCAYPSSYDGKPINQLENVVDKLSKDIITRRAVVITAVPEIDLFMKQDMPCLREIQFRAIENQKGELILNTHAVWRSRDLYKAWGDNIIGITNLVQIEIADPLAKKTGRKVIVGPYSEVNGSLHIYGQDYSEKGMNKFFDINPDEDTFIKNSMTSKDAIDTRIIPELEELKKEKTWRLTERELNIIDKLIEGYKSKKFIP